MMPGFSLANQLLHLLIGGWALVVATGTLIAEEGGTGHYAPGSLATLIDLPPTQPGWVVQPLFLHYEGEASRSRVFPIAGAITAGLNAKSDVFVVGATYTVEPKILGAYYSVGAYLPFAETEVSASVLSGRGSRVRTDRVTGLGDITLVPAMLAWKSGSWQYSALAQVYAPTGSYEVGRLANLGLNYWTLDTTVGVTYSDEPSGFNFSVLSGITLNSENKATNYRSGSVVHVEASVQQLFKHGDALIGIGANGFIYEQVTADSGAGAVLGSFKGRTGGIGPVVSYIRPLGTTTLALELRWLPELYAERRLQGDSIWFKGVLDF
jgi:hypothetical protein